jgi:hypothetical protein
VNYKVENSHSQFRTGTITVAGKIHTVYQVPK